MAGAITRRAFLELSTAALAGSRLQEALAMRAAERGAVVSVVDFGADPTGVRDSIGAVRRAIASLQIEGGILNFPQGTYCFVSDKPEGMIFRNLRNVEIRGNHSQWLFNGGMRPCAVDHCENITFRDVTIDWTVLPYSQGTVTGVGDRSFTIEIDAGYPVADHEIIRAIGSYDRATRWPMRNGVDSYNSVTDAHLIGPRTLRVMLKDPLPIVVGDTLVMRHNVYGVTGFRCESSSQIELVNVTFYALPGMGFFASRCNGIKLQQFKTILKPDTDRLMSICADGVHIANCTGAIDIANCHFQGMGDDAINICSTYTPVAKRLGSRTLLLQNDDGTALSLTAVPQPGVAVEICNRRTQALLGVASIVAASPVGGTEPGVVVELDRDLPTGVGAGALLWGPKAKHR